MVPVVPLFSSQH